MNLSAPFIRRPVATTLLTVAVALAGAVAFRLLPVAPLPQIDFPTISVQASLPGASPEIMASSVATPLERQFGRIAGVTEMTSASYLGSTSITLQFDLNRNIDGAARDVQAAINAARAYLPSNLPNNPTWRKVNPADAPILILALTSAVLDRGQLYDAASTILMQRLSQVGGVGQVTVGGSSLPAVRIEINPTQLNGYGLGLDAVRNALSLQNANLAKGRLANELTTADIAANDQLLKAANYQPLIIAYHNGAAVRLADFAVVEDSVENIRAAGFFNGKPCVMLIIFKQPQANIIDTVDHVRQTLPSLKAAIPSAIDLTIALDRTTTIRASVRDVEITLLISVVLVILVVFVFLRNPRTTLIPAVAVPVSLIGTFGAMYLFGYSLDNLSLMALTISTGFVVDDAIVVIEDIMRYLEQGMSPWEAALRGAREIGFTVLSISVSLVAVFIPILLMGGIVGRLFREFAVTLSVAILVSLVVSLTTTPMMCSKLLRPQGAENHGKFYLTTGRMFDHLLRGYERSLGWVLRHQALTLCVLLLAIAANFVLLKRIPKGFFPQQDTGVIAGAAQGAQDASFQAMQAAVARFVTIVKADPAVATVTAFTGGSGGTDTGVVFVSLKPLNERKAGATQVINRLRPKLARVTDASLFLQAAQDLRIGGRLSNAQYQYTIQSDNLQDLIKWAPPLLQQMKKLPGLIDVNSDQRNNGLQAELVYDRLTASRLGITPQVIDSALYLAFGQAQVSTMFTPLNQYHVVMEVAPKFWQDPSGLDDIYLQPTNRNGVVVPLAAVALQETSTAPIAVNHQGQFPSVTLSFNLTPGVALSDAVRSITQMEQRLGLPATIHGNFSGTLEAFQASLASEPFLIITALLAVYIVLGVLYESYVHPITILSTLPSAGVGAVLALMVCGLDLSIIAVIGIILLIGIVKKNGIMMVDFAIAAEREEGKTPADAIYQACVLRFRPILMTTMAATLGALPLVLGRGTGAELRRPLGIAIVGGLMASQALTLYTTPVVYLYLDRLSHWWAGWRRRPAWQAAAALLAGFVLLTGCNVSPKYARPAVQTPAAYKELPPAAPDGGEGWKTAQPKDNVIRGNWWEMFHDPELNALEARVNVSNQNIKSAYASFLAAQAVVRQARSQYFPTLTVSPSANRSQFSSSGNQFITGTGTLGQSVSPSSNSVARSTATVSAFSLPFAASWQPDLWGAVRNSVSQFAFAAQASAASLENIRLTNQAELAVDYFELRWQDALKQLLDATVVAFQKSLELTVTLYQTGIDSDQSVAQAETQLQTTLAQDTALGIQRAQFEHAIALLVGQPASTFSLPVGPLRAVPPAIPAGVPSQLLERRADIAAAERSVAEANAAIGVARAAYFPTLTLNGSAGFQSSSLGNLFSGSGFVWSVGGGLADTLFDAGRRRAVTEQARASYQQMVANYRQTVLTAFQGVEDNLAALRILSIELQQQDAAVKAAERNLDLATHRYETGIDSYLNVITAQTALLTDQQTALNLRLQQMMASVQLIMALGGGWDVSQLPTTKELPARTLPDSSSKQPMSR